MLNQTINTTLNNMSNHIATNTSIISNITLPVTNSLVLDIYIITLITSLFVTLVNKYLGDQVKVKALRKEMKTLNKEMRKVMKQDPKKAQNLQKEIMKKNMENMKYAFNPKIMLTTMIPLMIMFVYVKQMYSPFGEFFNFFGLIHFSWLGTYIVFSMFNSIIMKKILDVA